MLWGKSCIAKRSASPRDWSLLKGPAQSRRETLTFTLGLTPTEHRTGQTLCEGLDMGHGSSRPRVAETYGDGHQAEEAVGTPGSGAAAPVGWGAGKPVLTPTFPRSHCRPPSSALAPDWSFGPFTCSSPLQSGWGHSWCHRLTSG